MHFEPALLKRLRSAQQVVVFTGAGVSAESGIPTFRDALSGLWSQFDPALLASADGFAQDPALVWGWYEWRRMQALKAQPNPGHLAIAALARRIPALVLITQNVDDLHERAGSTEPLRLHGSLHHPRCFRCAAPYSHPPGLPDEPEGGRRVAPPVCPRCGSPIRPGVVWFGESLPEQIWTGAMTAAKNCDLLLSVGTSSVVWPAAALPELAARAGATVVQVNPAATALDDHAHYNLRGKAGAILPALLAALA